MMALTTSQWKLALPNCYRGSGPAAKGKNRGRAVDWWLEFDDTVDILIVLYGGSSVHDSCKWVPPPRYLDLAYIQ